MNEMQLLKEIKEGFVAGFMLILRSISSGAAKLIDNFLKKKFRRSGE